MKSGTTSCRPTKERRGKKYYLQWSKQKQLVKHFVSKDQGGMLLQFLFCINNQDPHFNLSREAFKYPELRLHITISAHHTINKTIIYYFS